jgi:hypothetical protein
MGLFYIETSTGHVATARQLYDIGVTEPELPWLRIQAPSDATTLWHSVMVKEERGVFIGTLTLRHGDHHRLLMGQGWNEIAPELIGSTLPGKDRPSEVSPSPWSDEPYTEPKNPQN